MKRAIGIAIVLTAGACALLAGPASAKRHGPAVRVALQACKQERGDLGVAAFRGKYGRRAMRNCLHQTTIEAQNAAQACRAELADIGIDAFREEHGTNQNGRNAFGKCVSETVTGDDASGGDSAPDQSGDETCDNSSPGGDETNPAVAVRNDEVSDEDESSDGDDASDDPSCEDADEPGDETCDETPPTDGGTNPALAVRHAEVSSEDEPSDEDGTSDDENCQGQDQAGDGDQAGDEEPVGDDDQAGDEDQVGDEEPSGDDEPSGGGDETGDAGGEQPPVV